jgi:hypothetical protein
LKKAFLSGAALLLVAASPAQERAAALSGEWVVDLRLSLDDEPYSQPMELAVDEQGDVTGNFYNSEILAGRTGAAQGRTCAAFRTTDGSGFYHTSACLIDGKMIGQTWSEGRNFVLPWTAERK